jgi:uncharacterized glyoxalase superfamily protein PhnB
MASLPFGPLSLILDQAEQDVAAVIAFESTACDVDFAEVVKRGAVVMDAPADQPWGVRVAYIQGPGALTIEIEQPLRG